MTLQYTPEQIETILDALSDSEDLGGSFYLANGLESWCTLIKEKASQLPEHVVIILTKEDDHYYAFVAKKEIEVEAQKESISCVTYSSMEYKRVSAVLEDIRDAMPETIASKNTYHQVDDQSGVVLTEFLHRVLNRNEVLPEGPLDINDAKRAHLVALMQSAEIDDTDRRTLSSYLRRYIFFQSLMQYWQEYCNKKNHATPVESFNQFKAIRFYVFTQELLDKELIIRLREGELNYTFQCLLENKYQDANLQLGYGAGALLFQLRNTERRLEEGANRYLSRPLNYLWVRGFQAAGWAWSLSTIGMLSSLMSWFAKKTSEKNRVLNSAGKLLGTLVGAYWVYQEGCNSCMSQMLMMASSTLLVRWLRNERVSMEAARIHYNKEAADWVMGGARLFAFLMSCYMAYALSNYRVAVIALSAVSGSYVFQCIAKYFFNGSQTSDEDSARVKFLSGMLGFYLGGTFSASSFTYLRKMSVRQQLAETWGARVCDYQFASPRSAAFWTNYNDTVAVRCGNERIECNITSSAGGFKSLLNCTEPTLLPPGLSTA